MNHISFQKTWVVLLCSLVWSFSGFSQPDATPISPKAKLLYEQSQKYILERKFDQALSVLEKAIEKEPNYAEAHFRLGNLYDLKSQTERADYHEVSLQHYQKSIDLKPKNPSFITAYNILGDATLRKGNYAKAKEYYQQFLDLRPAKQSLVFAAQKQIANCDYAIEAQKNPLPFNATPMPAPLNQFALQYFPVLTADQQTLIFTARTTNDSRSDEDIYISTRKNNEWTNPIPISDKINTVENEGTCTISADGRTLVFTNCDGRQSFGSCDLFVSYKIGNEWIEPINLGNKVNSPFWESQPALTADGRTLYFVSDRRGSIGKRDIWVSKLGEDGVWGIATNLGKNVNTYDDEVSPFIHVNGKTLFFSSKGHLGMGGFDLYESELDKGQWSFAKNLGYPLNTQDDQVSLFVSPDSKKGYFAHEERKGQFHIVTSKLYEFDFPEQIAIKNKSSYLKGIIYDAKTKKPIGARIELFNLNTSELEAVTKSDRKDGSYLTVLTEGTSYGLYVNADGYLFKSLSFDYTKAQKNNQLVMDIYLKPIETGAKDILQNLFFDTGKWELEGKSKTELEKLVALMKGNPKLKIEISGHTDDIGEDKANLELSQKRAKTVHEYLLKAGIDPLRLKYVGYGETQFDVPNTSDTNRQQNRRIEFKVL